jgi:FecR-like protein
MKRIKSILICGLVLALTGLTTLLVAASGDRNAKAIVRSVIGDVTYQTPGGQFMPLKVNMELAPQTVLKSGPGANAYLQVNGFTSTVKLEEKTTITLSKMENLGAGDSSTDLKLDGGQVLGKVKKLSANSDYKVTVPNGVAGIRGTDFQVSVTYDGTGNFTVVFTSVTGTIVCSVNLPVGQLGLDTRTLIDGQSWTVTGSSTGATLVINQPQTLDPAAYAAILIAFRTFPPPPPPTGGNPPPPPPPGTQLPPNTGGTYTGSNPAATGGTTTGGGTGPD